MSRKAACQRGGGWAVLPSIHIWKRSTTIDHRCLERAIEIHRTHRLQDGRIGRFPQGKGTCPLPSLIAHFPSIQAMCLHHFIRPSSCPKAPAPRGLHLFPQAPPHPELTHVGWLTRLGTVGSNPNSNRRGGFPPKF
eukprot:scaffold867_cov317-Pavlova_lutheri.AAC.22